jgi:hypothetical protein
MPSWLFYEDRNYAVRYDLFQNHLDTPGVQTLLILVRPIQFAWRVACVYLFSLVKHSTSKY